MSSHHTSQRFCLRWNNHQSNLLSVFDQLLHDESFVDVTLAVEGQFLKAHKMVLSACSPYFQALFTGHPDKHPIVILKDVPFADMRSLLDFMYRGEVSVDQDRLTAFLKVAETLRIKGLTEVNEERCDLPSIASSLLSSAGFTQGTQPSSQQQQQQQQQRQEQQQSQPPSLHRIHVPTKRSLQNSMASNPLLGSALTAPKRKRGRPRRLSGSDEHRNQSHKSSTDSEDQRHDDDSDAPSSGVHGPPDLLEVNMPDYHHSPPSRLSQSDTSPPPSEDSTPIGNDSDQPSSKVKPEFEEPTPGTSQQESGGGSQSPKSSSQDSESKLPSEPVKEDMTFTLCDNASESTESSLTPYEHPDLSLIIEDIEMSVASIKSEPETRSDGMDPDFTSGVHFLTDESESLKREVKDEVPDLQQQKRELLEYLIQEDNTVICKWCGEVLPSRTHWYRHKYKFHVSSPGNLYKCHKCNAFFKSKKGYMGHVNTRHWKPEDNGKAKSDVLKLKIVDCNLEGGLTEYKIVNNMELSPKSLKRVKSNFENIVNPSVIDEDYEKQKVKYEKEYEKQRQKEEQLVADIIDRVRKECEAQGSTVSRRGYSRRSTVMNSS